MNNQEIHNIKRNQNVIQVNYRESCKYVQAVKGSRTDTKQLNIHLKTHTLNCLKVAHSQHQLNQLQSNILKEYENMTPNFKSLQFLFHNFSTERSQKPKKKKKDVRQDRIYSSHKTLRKICSNFYKSTDFVSKILKSPRMHMKNKLILIKYLAKIQEKVDINQGPRDSWKCNHLE